jgi:alkylated DNA repair protein (DNA oxidative demethylase)
MPTLNLFDSAPRIREHEPLGSGAVILRGFAHEQERLLLRDVAAVAAAAPYRHMLTPGGHRMSVAMTNCGPLGWVSDRTGYRYESHDPLTGQPWPPMPAFLFELATTAAARAGYAQFRPDACLINRYQTGARMSLHRDQDEADAAAPIVSLSIGVPATFLWGGLQRSDKPRRILLESGDVVVWGGATRFVYHGVAPIKHAWHPHTGNLRINLTFRKVRP